MNEGKILLIDDEPNLLYSLRRSLQTEQVKVVTAETADDGILAVRAEQPDVVILDIRLPDMSGLDAFTHIREIDPRLPVIIITAYTTTDTAIEAMKRGAYEYLLKPVELDHLQEVVDRAIKISRMSHVPAMFQDDGQQQDGDHIIGRSSAMQEVYKAIGRVAPQDVTVLIQGESGTGKEMVARAIYHHSRRNQGPFLAINCAAIPEALLESELFGHERGSFTGAEARRIGKFEQVDGGTLFLDEIGDMSTATQAKVLRLLQEGTFERVGSNTTMRADVRVIAATNQELQTMVEQGRFRSDLYYRLKVFAITLPPLRERKDDIPLLVAHLVKVFNRELGKSIHAVSPEASQLIQQYHWPGNVRELQSAIKYAFVHAVGETLTPDCLPASCRQVESWTTDATPPGQLDVAQMARQLLQSGQPHIYRKVHSEVDRILLAEVLDHVDGNQAHASQLLGISRSTLRTRISDLGLSFQKRILPVDDPTLPEP